MRQNNCFGLLLAFGRDCIGAVSIVDPEPREIRTLELDDPEQIAALAGRASLSGVQPKMTAKKTGKGYEPATQDSGSTHIAKLPSRALPDILELELLTRLAAILLVINMMVAICTTKIPIFLKDGFWKMAHKARTNFCMLLGYLFLLIVVAGAWSLDQKLTDTIWRGK